MTTNEWKEKVRVAILKKNGQKLIENCTSVDGQDVKIHTKTKHIYEKLTNNRYKGTPIEALVRGNKQKTRTIFLAQNGMLECGRNMKGTIPEICPECNETDNEQHRLTIWIWMNVCIHLLFIEFQRVQFTIVPLIYIDL